jgi:signal transduction histidine kinase
MLGVVSLVESETTDKDIAGDIILLKNSINKLDGFIGDILDYSRNSRMEIRPQEISFEVVLNDIKNHLKYMASANSNVDVRTNIVSADPFFSDKTRLSIILNNLISNAIRYSDPKVADSHVTIDINADDKCARIIIEDNGIGIARENQDKIFNMFYRVSKKSVGSGLGLYIVKETVEKLHGKMHFESELGKGTRFTITIPNLNNKK